MVGAFAGPESQAPFGWALLAHGASSKLLPGAPPEEWASGHYHWTGCPATLYEPGNNFELHGQHRCYFFILHFYWLE